MNRDLLFRFFEGKTNLAEEKLIRHWMESSGANQKFFTEERMAYDIMLMNSPEVTAKQTPIVKFSPWMWGAAACVVLLISVGILYLMNLQNGPVQYTTILVPPGQRVNLILADSTNVWLNANSSLRYPTEFMKDTRTIYLDGEAYFDVTKNKKKPFTVKTKQGDIRVTGTRFNVDAYSKYGLFETSLFEGGVELYKNNTKLATLKPDEKSTLKNGRLTVSPITGTDSYLWRKGLIAFRNEKLEEILHSFSKNFNVEIKIQAKKLPQETYTGKFRQAEGLDYALQILQKNIRFNYQKDDKTGVIYIK